MNFKDTVVYLILAIFILAIAIALLLLASKNPSYGDKVSVPKAKGFSRIEITNWNAYTIQKNTTIEIEFKSADELPVRVELYDNEEKISVKVMRNREICKVIGVETYYLDKKVHKSQYSPYISGNDKLKMLINIEGNNCDGITGQGYVYLINFPIELHDKTYVIEEGIITGFFS
ncbi:MAG: hypothetical protein N3E37_02500 [Candidatus Micrarchaeota archaeon]|nr:hypothetical protein [Candidatus Micrarchaeota archaeon]